MDLQSVFYFPHKPQLLPEGPMSRQLCAPCIPQVWAHRGPRVFVSGSNAPMKHVTERLNLLFLRQYCEAELKKYVHESSL